MITLKKLAKLIKTIKYKKYRKSPCPNCNGITWKYAFAPYVMKGKKGLLEARVCNTCGFKDPAGHFLDSDLKMDDNTTFINKNK